MLLRKGVYPYEYMDSWKRFNETSLTPKKSFYSELNLEDITDKDYLYARILSAPGLAWQTYLKKTNATLELLTVVDM